MARKYKRKMTKHNGYGEQGSVYFDERTGRWVGAISLGVVHGRQGRRKGYGASRDEVVNKLVIGVPMPIGPACNTVGDYLDAYLAGPIMAAKRATTKERYEQIVRRHIKPLLGNH